MHRVSLRTFPNIYLKVQDEELNIDALTLQAKSFSCRHDLGIYLK